jgi:hypothetical protein
MRWPCVSRARFDDYIARHLAFYQRSVAQYDELLEKYHALATLQPVTAREARQPADMPERKPSLIDEVIREQAGNDPRLIMHFKTYASKLRNEARVKGESLTDEELAQQLMNWTSTEIIES